MAKDTTKEIVKKAGELINTKAKVNEAYFVGLMWANPFESYAEYAETLSRDEFVHDVWGFYFDLGRHLYEAGIKNFDDISVLTKVKDLNIEEDFKEFGGMRTIGDAVDIVKESLDNIEYYHETIKKNYVIRQLFILFGDKVLIKKGKYDYEKMTKDELTVFWTDKMNSISLGQVSQYEVEDLYIEADEFMRKLEEESAEMLPFHNSYMLNSITQGVPKGSVFMWGGFGNTGKSSIMAEKFVMSLITNREKCIIVLNEEDAQSFRQKIVLSIMFHEFHTGIDRTRMLNNKLQEKDRDKIRQAFARMRELMDGEESQIKVIFMDKYVMKDLEKIVRFWANRGYDNLLIDTHKVSDDSSHDKRWETFVEDMKTIYRFTRKNSGGLNLRTMVTFQLADSAIRNRYLTFDAIGEGKASKNEAASVMMFRAMWSDEYEGGKNELSVHRMRENKKTGEYEKEEVVLDKEKTYYLVFTPKNRTGSNNDTGMAILVLEPQFNANHFKEIGWTYVAKDFSR